jgi:hypothetical protein
MEIDPRGPRTAALITTAVLAAVLITGSGWLLAVQALVFAAGAVFGLRYSPYGVLYRKLIRPRLGPPRELEPEAPPRFGRAGCRVPERGLRVLPGLRNLPAHPPDPARSPGPARS